jgi:hypothetical protein
MEIGHQIATGQLGGTNQLHVAAPELRRAHQTQRSSAMAVRIAEDPMSDLRISIPITNLRKEQSLEVLGCEQPTRIALVSWGGLVISPAARSPEVPIKRAQDAGMHRNRSLASCETPRPRPFHGGAFTIQRAYACWSLCSFEYIYFDKIMII